MNDLFKKKMDRKYGQTRKTKPGSTFVLHAVTTMCRYIISGSWQKHGMHKREERVEQRWQPRRRARAPSSMVHACFPCPAAARLPSYVISEQCVVLRFLFRRQCSSHYIISTRDVCVCVSTVILVRYFRLYTFVLWLPVGNEGDTVAL
jgi:hypothetical protein